MLTAYYDDSGTHVGADITLLAGVFGNQWQWKLFNDLWKAELDSPLEGAKPRLRRFHMTDCFNSLNEFTGWSRTETDFFAHRLGEILFRCGLWGCATSVTGKAWDEQVKGDLRRASGDAEGGAIRNSFHLTLDWSRNYAPHEGEIAFVFEDRPERKREYEIVYNVFSDYARETNTPPQPVSLTFANAAKILPLQAADLFAWEVYRDELHFLNHARPAGKFNRKLLTRMASSGRFRIQSATPDTIRRMVKSLTDDIHKHPKMMSDLDKYFGKL
jgi:hypothetical protein